MNTSFPRKPYPIPDLTGQSRYPFSEQNGPKTLPFGAAHTYMAYTREYPPPRGVKQETRHLFEHRAKPKYDHMTPLNFLSFCSSFR